MGRAVDAGTAKVTLSIDGAERAVRSLQRKLAGIGAGLGRLGGMATAAGGTMLAAFYKPVTAASDLQEVMSKFDTVFGDQAESVKAWGDEFAGQVGRSKRQVAEFLAGSQDLLVPMGLDPKAAQETSKQLTELAVDLASFNNMTDADAMRDLQAALTGSGEVMKKYGVIVSQSAVNQELLNKNLDPKSATEAEKAMARLDIIMRGTTAAQGDATRTASSFANRMKALWATVEDVNGSLGKALLPTLAAAAGHVQWALTLVGNFAEKNQGLVQTLFAVAAGVTAAGVLLVGLGGTFALASVAIGAVLSALSAIGSAFALLVSPIGLVTAAVVAGVGYFALYTETGQAMVADAMSYFGDLGSIAGTTFGGIRDALANGDIEAAGKILWTGLEVLWLRGTAPLRETWEGLIGGMRRGWRLTGDLLLGAADSLFTNLAIGLNSLMAFFERTWARIKAFFGGDANDEIARINSELAASNEILAGAREERKRNREKDRRAFNDSTRSDAAAAVEAAEQRLADAKKELADLAERQRVIAEESTRKAAEEVKQGEQAAQARNAVARRGDSGSGTFNAAAIASLLRVGKEDPIQQAQLTEAQKQTKLLGQRLLVTA